MVKVLLERTIKGTHVKEITRLLRMLRVLAMQQPGYISGETLHEIDTPNNYLVISAWYSREDWQAWLANQERQKLQAELDGYMEAPTRFRVYTY
ncbi:MAG: antibiotic biosynthesis monooxygenase family protein [Desulfobaccales bacterium]